MVLLLESARLLLLRLDLDLSRVLVFLNMLLAAVDDIWLRASGIIWIGFW